MRNFSDISERVGKRTHFIPYIEMHEFESMLFANPRAYQGYGVTKEQVDAITKIKETFETPEHINNSYETAPSKRLMKSICGYENLKVSHGSIYAGMIGVETIRKECRHFDSWIVKLEELAKAADFAKYFEVKRTPLHSVNFFSLYRDDDEIKCEQNLNIKREKEVHKMIAEDLIKQALVYAQERKIKEIRLGLGYTCAVLENNACGLAYTFRNQLGHSCGVLTEAGKLIGQACETLIPWLKDKNLIKAAIGLAVINALLNNPSSRGQTGNVVDAIEIKPEETFGMVGAFAPILHVIKPKTKNIYVFERGSAQEEGWYSDETIPLHLPKCDVVVITATSILNHTIDEILPFCAKARQVCIVGLSTPLVPEVFQQYNVTLLAGSVVTDTERMLQIISQGGGMMHMKPALRHVLIRL
ncbi:MAG: DUF4276 family protein [Desulfosporosinus sp.]